MKTLIHYAAGIIFSLCLMVTLLITSVEAVVYWTPGYFEKEYVLWSSFFVTLRPNFHYRSYTLP